LAILDTDILVSLLKGDSDAIEKIKTLEDRGEQLSTTIVTACELLKGAYISSRSDENLVKVRDSISTLQVLELSLVACEEAAKIYKWLKEKGDLIGEFDILIAAITRSHDEMLVTRDEHFRSIREFKIIKW
jgi:tRNA(fMet)-specific endonuclease VapC